MLNEKKTLDPQQAFQCLIRLQERRVALVEAVEKIDLSQSADFARTYYKLAQKVRRLREVNVEAERLLSGDP